MMTFSLTNASLVRGWVHFFFRFSLLTPRVRALQCPPHSSEMCLFNVDGGQRAVIFDRFQGVKEAVVGEGTHFMIPVVQKPIVIDVRARPRTINSITGTKDLQMANISLRVLSRPLEEELPRIYQELGTDFDDRVLPSLGNEVCHVTNTSMPCRAVQVNALL